MRVRVEGRAQCRINNRKEPLVATDDEVREVRMCTIMPTPPDKVIAAAIKAVEENPDNAPLSGNVGGPGVQPHEPFAMAAVTGKQWMPGRTLRVSFTDGDPGVQAKVESVAKEWEQHANLILDFGAHADPEIRVSFQQQGSWSYLGTDALVIADDSPTMNYGWLTPATADDEYSRVVLHEFGHAMACIHEHNHPEAGIPWDLDAVYRYYMLTQGWTKDDVDSQVLRRYERDLTNFSAYDATSIMHYAVPNELTLGDFEVGWNRVLSQTDKDFIAVLYPGVARDARELHDGERVAATIGAHGEEDKFTFTAASGGDYTIETDGTTDVVMGLFGPDDRTRLVDFDDDSGSGLNARISAQLDAGDYFVRVRHYWPRGTGAYSITMTAS